MAKQKVATTIERDGFAVGGKLYAFLPNVKGFIDNTGTEVLVEDALKNDELLEFLVKNKSCIIECLGEAE